MQITKTCYTCEHRHGTFTMGTCARTGTVPDMEMKYGGRCAGPARGTPEMNLWEPRRTIWMRIKAATRTTTGNGE